MPTKELKSISESNSIKDFLTLVDPQTSAVLFDLDNTVIWPGTYLGSDQWFMRLFEYFKGQQVSPEQLIPIVLAVYNEVQFRIKMELTEEYCITLLQQMREQHIPVIGITARGKTLAPSTLIQLQELGIEFDEVIFCSGQSKGQKLLEYLHENQLSWQNVAMIDDKEKHLHDVGDAMNQIGVAFRGLRYSRMDTAFTQEQDNVETVQETIRTYQFFPPHVQEQISAVTAPQQSHHSPA